MRRIDAHVHYNGDHAACLELLDRLDVRLLNICVSQDSQGMWRRQAEMGKALADHYPHRYAWCTSFDTPRFDDPGYAHQVVEQLGQDLQAGAVACKIWKNIGMEIRKPSGEFLMADDPLFDPLYDYLEQTNTTLVAHLAEPLACWQPLDPSAPHYNYFRTHPEWHMASRPGFPSHGEIMEARDRVLGARPGLRVVGAHLASLEYNVTEIANRLDRFPNLAVDTSARLLDLAAQDTAEVRQFFIDYQDRILFGTDIVQREPVSTMPQRQRQRHFQHVARTYQTWFDFLEMDRTVAIGDHSVKGLGLAWGLLEKLYFANTLCWFPSLRARWA